VDSVIQKVGGAIEGTERLKKGLMQRLLTRGIGHKRLKESEVGRVPEEWEVGRLGDACHQRNEITMPSGKGENKFVGLEHINPGEIGIHNYQLDTEVKSSKFRFHRGDILYGKLRPYLDKAVIADFEGICSTDLLVLTNTDKALAEFLIYLIHSNKFIQNSISATSGTNHPRTSWKEISKFKFGLPPLPEQRRIAEILSAADRKLELERRRKEKLERVKQGLMNDLLTGRKRMKVD
jgi:type I restriction enzyme S subunit